MSYSPFTWVEKVSKVGPTNLNHLELGLQTAAAVADAANALAIAALPTPGGSNGQFLKRVGGVWVPTSFAASDIPAASLDQTFMAAGNKTTTSLLSGGPPGSPTTGDIWIATAVDTGNLATTNGTRWIFQYNGTSGSSFKWEFIGGTPALTSVATSEATTSGTFVDVATVGPSVTVARAGDYIFDAYFQAAATATGGGNAQSQLFKNGTTLVGLIGSANMVNVAGAVFSVAWKQVLTGLSAADAFKLRYAITNGVNTSFGARALAVTPIRIS